MLLEDLEVIELESKVSEQQFIVPGANRQLDESVAKNKQMLDHILHTPSLFELL